MVEIVLCLSNEFRFLKPYFTWGETLRFPFIQPASWDNAELLSFRYSIFLFLFTLTLV